MKCLVLGGGGFLGTHLCAGLRRLGHNVRVFERLPAPAGSDAAEWVVGEFTRPEHIGAAVAGCDVVFHLVSTTLPQTSNDDPAHDVHSNVESSLALFEAARRHCVAKVVFVSSGGTVYGIPQRIPIRRPWQTRSRSVRGRAAERATPCVMSLDRRLNDIRVSSDETRVQSRFV